MSNFTFQIAKGLKAYIVTDHTAAGSGYRRLQAETDGWWDIDNTPTAKRLAYADEIGTSFWSRATTTVTLANAGDDVLLNTDEQIQFRSVTQYITSNSANNLLINFNTGGALTIGIAGVSQFEFDSTAFYPSIAGMDLGKSSSNEFVDGYFSGNVYVGTAPTSGTHATNKDYVDGLFQGGLVDWQDSVLDIYDPTAGTPGTPATGDRYISSATANGWTINNIYEYDGAAWDETVVSEGMASWVEDEDVVYVFNGTSWVKMSSTVQHNNLAGLQGGTTDEYYHLTSAEYTALSALDSLTNNYFWMGNASNVATEVIMSSDITMTNTGVTSIGATKVTGAMLNDDVISAQGALASGLAAADEFLISDAGVIKKMAVSVLSTYMDANLTFGDMDNPMDSIGDVIYGGASGVATKLDHGTEGYVLTAHGAAAPTWAEMAAGLWTLTANVTDVYRNSKVSIGHTANPSAQLHIVENAADILIGHTGTVGSLDMDAQMLLKVDTVQEVLIDTNLVQLNLATEFVFGPDDTDGSWKMYVSGGEFIVEKYVTAAWVESSRFSV